MLAYGVPSDLVDEYVCMSEFTCLESLYMFCKVVVTEYLREPSFADATWFCLRSMNQEAF